jgi:hypothetical protein
MVLGADCQVALSPASGQTFGDGPGNQYRRLSVHHLQPHVVMESGGVMLLDDELVTDKCG